MCNYTNLFGEERLHYQYIEIEIKLYQLVCISL